MKKVLVLAPHTDDGELGCGGTVARLLEEGCEVHFAVFSTCAESVPAGFPADATASTAANTSRVRTPRASAVVPARWMTGPSRIGSEYGRPISTMSTPGESSPPQIARKASSEIGTSG